MRGFVADIEDLANDNAVFRRVLYTGRHMQLVLMTLAPGEDIGGEIHAGHDQFFRIEEGEGVVEIDGERTEVAGDDAILVPAGARHNLINTGRNPLKLYTLYGPPEHRDGLVQNGKADAAVSAPFDGSLSE